jgi:hypothetical protein
MVILKEPRYKAVVQCGNLRLHFKRVPAVFLCSEGCDHIKETVGYAGKMHILL